MVCYHAILYKKERGIKRYFLQSFLFHVTGIASNCMQFIKFHFLYVACFKGRNCFNCRKDEKSKTWYSVFMWHAFLLVSGTFKDALADFGRNEFFLGIGYDIYSCA